MPGYWEMLAQAPQNQVGQNFLQAYQVARQTKLAEKQAAQQSKLQEMAIQQAEREQQAREAEMLLPEAQSYVDRAKAVPGTMQAQDAQGMMQKIQAVAPQAYQAWEQKRQIVDLRRRAFSGDDAARQQLMTMYPEDPSLKIDPFKLDEYGVRVVQDFGLKPGSPEFQQKVIQLRETDERARVARARAGATIVNTGSGPAVGLTTGQASKVQSDVMDASKNLAQLDRAEKYINAAGGWDKVASLWNRGGAAVNEKLAPIPIVGEALVSDQDRKDLESLREADAAISTFRNQIFNKLSGAAVSESEMGRLMQSVPAPEDSAPTKRAKMNVWRSNLEFEKQYGLDALVNGLRTGYLNGSSQPPPSSSTSAQQPASTPQVAQRVQPQEPAAPPKPTVSGPSEAPKVIDNTKAVARATQLRSEGKTAAQIAETLKAEGLIQ